MDVGKLNLKVIWNEDSVSATEIRSTRPMVAQILKGKTPGQVVQIVPLLFSVCGRAQGAAASAALQAAQQSAPTEHAAVELAIVCEAIQEHLWRLMLDWPKLLGLPQHEQRFAGWYALLRKIGAGEIGMDAFLREFEREGLGVSASEWYALDSYAALQTWWCKVHSPLAQMLAKLDELEHDKLCSTDTKLLPAWTACEANQACGGRWDAAFSARPDWLGCAAETGAWTYFPESKLLGDTWHKSGSKALPRLLAKIMDICEMASGRAAPRLDVTSPSSGVGTAVVRTARGLLMHHVCLDAEKVTDYVMVAPTEWNFHPNGAFAKDMSGLKESDAECLQQLANIAALSLDPCVAYEVKVQHA